MTRRLRIVLFYVVFQAVITLLIAFLMLIFVDFKAAYSSLIAGVIGMTANTYFALRLLRYRVAREAKRFVWVFYTGEITKLALIVALMLMALVWLPLSVGPFLLTFVIVQIASAFAPLVVDMEKR